MRRALHPRRREARPTAALLALGLAAACEGQLDAPGVVILGGFDADAPLGAAPEPPDGSPTGGVPDDEGSPGPVGGEAATGGSPAPVGGGPEAGAEYPSGGAPAGGEPSGGAPAGGEPPPPDPCRGVACGAGGRCRDGDCECFAGFRLEGGGCVAAPVTPLEARAEAEVCDRWRADSVGVGPEWVALAPGDACDPGEVPEDAQQNAIRRTNLYRWQAGLDPVVLEPGLLPRQQACAAIMAARGGLEHAPQPGSPCYTPEGAQGAGSSNLSGGGGLADSVDLYVTDPGFGNEALGHRRWVLNPAAAVTAFGYKGGFGCMYSFSMEHPHQVDFVAWPPPGWLPVQAAQGLFHVALYRASPGPDFHVQVALGEATPWQDAPTRPLEGSYGMPTAAYGYDPPGGPAAVWQAGTVLRVALRGLAGRADIEFTTRFTDCR